MNNPPKIFNRQQTKSPKSLLMKLNSHNRSNFPFVQYSRSLKLSRNDFNRAIEVFEWRFKTWLPIIKPQEYSLNLNSPILKQFKLNFASPSRVNSPNKQSSDRLFNLKISEAIRELPHQQSYELQVKIQVIKHRLCDIVALPFPQIIYLLKEMMIGYDVLKDIFGTFDPTDDMIAVNANDQWRIWIHSDFLSFQKSREGSMLGQKQFIYRLIVIAQKHCLPSNLTKTFFTEIKQFTYSNQCNFIKTIQKIKDFITQNKIFQVNKVKLPFERVDKTFFNMQISKATAQIAINKNKSQSFFDKFQQQKMDKPQQTTSQIITNNHSASFLGGNIKRSQFIPLFSNLTGNRVKSPDKTQQGKQKAFSPSIKIQANMSNSNFHNNCVRQRHQNNYRSQFIPFSTFFQKHQKHVNLEKQMDSKNRIEDKLNKLINSTHIIEYKSVGQVNEINNLQKGINSKNVTFIKKQTQDNKKKVQKRRKFSQQVQKCKSLDLLISKSKMVRGSGIYDPQMKVLGVKMANKQINTEKQQFFLNYPTKVPTVYAQYEYSKTIPNKISSNQDLKPPPNPTNSKWFNISKNLKIKESNINGFRNNQSHHSGMGVVLEKDKRLNNSSTGFDFARHQVKNQAKPERSQSVDRMNGNNWKNKISGLFSDNASIKQMKASVKINTGKEQRFQKQHLKNVKLQKLQKFGRQVRDSLVEDQQCQSEKKVKSKYVDNNNHNSMQLIQQVIDDQKSCIDLQKRDDKELEIRRDTRARNNTVLVIPATVFIQSDPPTFRQKQCVSQYNSSSSSSDDIKYEDLHQFQQIHFN